jgi:protoporphyrinogen/coproporphyrinogen III oxidase
MSLAESTPRRVAVIGGGIAGLAAAHRLVELDPQCDLTLFEAGPRLGGVVSTVLEDGFQVEQSADNFITTVPWGVNLCKRLGLGDQLIGTNPAYRRTFVVHRGRLHRLPDGFLMMAPTRLWPLAVTPLLSPMGKVRAAMEYVIPPRADDADESMAHFVRRRLGREAFERLVEPLVSAVYAADLEKLSVLATLPRFREMERDFGSLIRAMRHQMRNRPKPPCGAGVSPAQAANAAGTAAPQNESGARYSMFVTLRDGLSSLVDAIAARLPSGAVQLNTPVTHLERFGQQWRVSVAKPQAANLQISKSPNPQTPFDALILATPSPVSAALLQPLDATLATDLASIEHSGTAILSLGYRADDVGHPLDGMGAVVPAVEKSPILAVSFSSQKYAHRAPEGKTLLRVFVGGARRPEVAAMSDADLTPLVLDELTRLFHIHGQSCYRNIARWPGTMPQYHVGHKELVAQIEARVAALPNVALAGNAYHGVGLPDCIHGGELAAERILAAY